MGLINYGTIRLADVSPEDVELFYTFTPDRVTAPPAAATLLPSSLLTPVMLQGEEQLGGLYSLRLAKEYFLDKGIYTIMIRPKQHRVTIMDCGGLAGYDEIRGVVLNKADFPDFVSNSFNGYLIEYFDVVNGKKRRRSNVSRIVTSSNLVDAVSDNRINQKTINYRITQEGSLIFLTVSPSGGGAMNPTGGFIGFPGQEIALSNTFFDPMTLEIEMADHDLDTLGYALYGNQTMSKQDGTYTVYNDKNQIFAQYNLYEIKDENGAPLFEVREKKDVIDESKGFDDITADVND